VVDHVVEGDEKQKSAEDRLVIIRESHRRSNGGHDDPDVLHARVGEEALQVALDHGVQDPDESRERTECHHEQSPPHRPMAEQLEAKEHHPVHAELDDEP
jgi:hypothetical protein